MNPNDSGECSAKHEFDIFDFEKNVLTTIGWTVMKCGTDVHALSVKTLAVP